MGSNPINLFIRFLLELVALYALGRWGWMQGGNGLLRIVYAVLIVVLAATLWATFAVPDDPSRSGEAPVPVPGILRLVLELAFFAIAVWAMIGTGLPQWGITMGMVVLIHYLVSYDRVMWLLSR